MSAHIVEPYVSSVSSVVSTCLPLLPLDVILVWSQTFTYYMVNLGWPAVKQACECTGHLAILDTEAKQMALLNQV